MKNTHILVVTFFVIGLIAIAISPTNKSTKSSGIRTTISPLTYKKLKPSLYYTDSIPELQIHNLTMIGRVGRFGVDGIKGKLLRALRFQNISDAVEERYNLPRHIILAMMMEESSGVDCLPNGLGDGGFGLCHMQSIVAKEFGLQVYQNCSAMVCNGTDPRSCKDSKGRLFNHARDLKELIHKNESNRQTVIRYDERLSPVLNLDAVGRMLASHMDGRPIKGFGPLRTAIARYAGLYNYKDYWRDVRLNMKALANESLISEVEAEFNRLNPTLTINGESADFRRYIALSQNQNYNYGLAQYQSLPMYLPKNSEKVIRTLDNF